MELRDKKGLTEEEFLIRYRERSSQYPRPFLTADCVILAPGSHERERQVLLIRRGGHPFLGCLALPGGFAQQNETLEQAAERELSEETGVHAPMTLLGIYSEPNRDPRGWIVSAAYLADLPRTPGAQAADDAADAVWARLEEDQGGIRLTLPADLQDIEREILLLPPSYAHPAVAFDHGKILAQAWQTVIANDSPSAAGK